MKKIIISTFAIALLISCKTNSSSDSQPTNDSITIETAVVAVIDEHNAQNSLDYMGTYKGVLPTASGEGMEVTITLSDNTYTKSTVYIGKDAKPFEEKGSYSWNENGNTITLDNLEKPNQYLVQEGKLVQLDVEGNKITGDLADKYTLKQQN